MRFYFRQQPGFPLPPRRLEPEEDEGRAGQSKSRPVSAIQRFRDSRTTTSAGKSGLYEVVELKLSPDTEGFRHGIFLISLDYELYWGVRDKRSAESYAENLARVPQVIEALLGLFERYEIHATWATVGALFLNSLGDFSDSSGLRPGYHDAQLCPYRYIEAEVSPVLEFHLAPDCIRKIAASPRQEVGTHTFSHFYCMEPGVTEASFRHDLERAVKVGEQFGCSPRSIVFPRNQWREDYLPLLREFGIKSFRGNQNHWIYRSGPDSGQTFWLRGFRLLDSYLNLSGHHTFDPKTCMKTSPIDLPASAFLRPFSRRLAFLEPVRLRRIVGAMRHAASHRLGYHLWWHPHNFGRDLNRNLSFLERILEEYLKLKQQYGYRSLSMGEAAEGLCSGKLLGSEK